MLLNKRIDLPIVVVSGVLDLAHGTVRLNQGVASMDGAAVAGLMLRLVVAGVRVCHGIRVVVFGVGLELHNHIEVQKKRVTLDNELINFQDIVFRGDLLKILYKF